MASKELVIWIPHFLNINLDHTRSFKAWTAKLQILAKEEERAIDCK